VHDHEDVVVKPIPPAIMETGIYAGTTLLDDGRPMMLLDVPNIARDCGMLDDLRGRAENLVEEESAAPERPRVPVMLFTGLDGRRRAVRLDLVQRIDTVEREAIDIEGPRAQVVIDDRLFALVGHDDGPLPDGRCRLLRLSDGESELALIVAEVLDAAEIDEDMHGDGKDPRYAGVALLAGRPVPVVDAHRLFAEHGNPVAAEPAPARKANAL
ncbi:MAG TPA: hypothetical protein VLQ65_02635, partial [Saliniramus sp.]|nr:hypothetical protein [Saliniramus sp.]